MTHVSIIIPTLNEATCLPRTFRYLSILDPPAWEIVVVDGASQDETVTQALTWSDRMAPICPVRVCHTNQPGRSRQMNQGADIATGDILCFLHADTLVPDDLITVIQTTLANPAIACGGFISLMAGAETTRWDVSLHNLIKTYYAPLLFRPYQFFFRGLRLLFGDQVMFCRRSDFWAIGGFDATLPIMEEADLCKKLARRGRICQVNRVVQSSDRRVARWGTVKATFVYLAIGFLWGLGVSATTLKQWYEEVR